jgi:hypothetical protein
VRDQAEAVQVASQHTLGTKAVYQHLLVGLCIDVQPVCLQTPTPQMVSRCMKLVLTQFSRAQEM